MRINVYRIGAAAVEALGLAEDGSVAGVTSRGAFLRVADRIIYLTPLDYQSPFNLTLAGGDERFERLAPGDHFSIDSGNLVFPTQRITVETGQAEVWEPPLPVTIKSTLAEQYDRAMVIAKGLRQIDAQKGYLFLSQPGDGTSVRDALNVTQTANAIAYHFYSQKRSSFLRTAASLLGSGAGLTPSGDDFLTGFFLYHFRREQSSGIPSDFLAGWCADLSALAFQKTTTISANRLMFTARGWSEDIFLNLIDHLFDPAVSFSDERVCLLMEIGHSSGVDTFMGIIYAIKSIL